MTKLLPIALLAATVTAGALLVAGQQAAAAQPGAEAVRTIQSIEFVGNAKLSTAQLQQAIGIKVGDVNTREAIGGALAKIVEAYRAKGSDLAVMVDISLPDATHTAVKFLIDEAGTGGNKGAAPRGPRGGGPGGPGGAGPGGPGGPGGADGAATSNGRIGVPPVPPPATRQ